MPVIHRICVHGEDSWCIVVIPEVWFVFQRGRFAIA